MGTQSASPEQGRLSPAARALLQFLPFPEPGAAGATSGDLSSQVWDEVLELALRHGVASLLLRGLQSRGVLLHNTPVAVIARLEQERRAAGLDNLRNFGQFQRVANALHAEGIPVVALKGLHLAELVYRDISLRPMSDLDVLVPRSQVEQAVDALRRLGYGCAEDLAGAAGELLDIKCNIGFAHREQDVWLELHWSLDEPPAHCREALDAVWRSAVPARLGDADACVMSAEFLLLHVCAHLACNHTFAFSLHALCDIAEIVRMHPELDWSVVVAQGRRNGWGRGVPAALRLAADHLGAAVPSEVLAKLGADTLDPAMLATAMEHLVSCIDLPDALRTAPNLMALAGMRGPVQKLAALSARVFIPRAELALKYGVAEGSPQLYLHYAVRMADLLRKYAASAWAMGVSDSALAAAAARQAKLAAWIKQA